MKIIFFVFTTIFTLSCSNPVVLTEASKIEAPFDGKKFDNLEPFPDKNFFQLMKWKLGSLFKNTKWDKKTDQKFYRFNRWIF